MSERLAANLWRWTAPSPHWTPAAAAGPDPWPRDVGCVVYVRDGTATVIDPLVADDGWAFLDERVAAADRVVVALAAPWHRRDAAQVAERYGAEVVIHRAGLERLAIPGARAFDGDGPVAAGVEALVPPGLDEGEPAYWIPEHGALVTAEVLQGTADGLRAGVSPDVKDQGALEAWLHGLERLPIELVLPTHGPPARGPVSWRP